MSKKIFISYAWGDKKHQEWVVDLAKRLMEDTVDVILDRWSLKDGHDIYEFMESMVKSEDIFRVLIICDKNYKNKSDGRNGGVGTETQIITPAIYGDQKQEKFIPIVIERNEEGNPYLPIYMGTRKYIDFSADEYFEASYEDLLRNILEAPSIPKPKLGTKAPLYITESPSNNYETSSLVRVMENQLKNNPEKVNSYAVDFIGRFLETLKDFEFNPTNHDLISYGDDLMKNLHSYRIFRNDFIDWLLIVTKTELDVDVEIIINFFEQYLIYCERRGNTETWAPQNVDNYKIIFQELFIYTIATCLKNNNYKLLSDLLHSKYYLANAYRDKENRYTSFYQWHENMERYNEAKNKKIAAFGQYIISSLNEKISKQDIILADLICYYVGDLFSETKYSDNWFPATYIFKDHYNTIDFFEKFSSNRHFDKVKPIFAVDNVLELKNMIVEYKEKKEGASRDSYGRGGRDSIPFLFEILNVDTIAKNR